MSNTTYACFRCRIAWKAGNTVCTRCGVAGVNMGTRWRAPKSNNLKAWRQIVSGDIWWDEKAIWGSERIQADLRLRDFWANRRRLTQKKPGSMLPYRILRKIL